MPVDLFFLQETHLADHSQGKTWEKEWGGQCAWSPGSNRSAGIAVLVHPNSAATLVDHKSDLAGRVVTVSIDFHGHRFQLLGQLKGTIKHNAFAWLLALLKYQKKCNLFYE